MRSDLLVVSMLIIWCQSLDACGAKTTLGSIPRQAGGSSVELYVAPTGNDHNSGSIEHPLATIQKATELVRSIDKKSLKTPVSIIIRGGTYYLDKPLVLDGSDSGTFTAPVVYRAYAGENVILSGGIELEGPWKKSGSTWQVTILKARNQAWPFSELYVNGARKIRTRLPQTGHFTFVPLSGYSTNEFIFKEGDLKRGWQDSNGIEVVVLQHWMETRGRISRIDWDNHHLLLDASSWRPLVWSGGYNSKTDSVDQHAYYVENVFEALQQQPGAWYLERHSGVLHYNPEIGESPPTASTVIAPRIKRLISLEGTNTRPIHDIYFKNLNFSHTAWHLPAHGFTHPQAELPVPAAIEGTWTKHAGLINCELSHLGGWGVSFGEGTENIEISCSRFFDVGAGAIKVGSDKSVTPIENVARAAAIVGNVVSDGAKTFFGSPAVWIGHSSNNVVASNDISGPFHFGISVGWRWDSGFGNRAIGNIIEHNDIHNIGSKELGAHSAIYTLGRSPGTVILGNYIHDNSVGFGIALDNGSAEILVKDNIVYRTASGLILNYDSLDNSITNNIFALSDKEVIRRFGDSPACCRGRPISSSFAFRSNIVYWKRGVLFGDACWPTCDCDQRTTCHGQPSCSQKFECAEVPNCRSSTYNAIFESNLYFHQAAEAATFLTCTFENWRARGYDEDSIVANPLFEDVEHGDFTIPKGSPAFEIGFVPIDVKATVRSTCESHPNR